MQGGAAQPSKWPGILSLIFLVLAVVGRWPYGFYVLLRLTACLSAVYLAYWAHDLRKKAWVWIMAGTAVVFNPVIPIRLHRSDWQIIDAAAAAVFGIALALIR